MKKLTVSEKIRALLKKPWQTKTAKSIANAFKKAGRKIRAFFRKMGETKAAKKLAYGLSYIPKKIADRLPNKARKSLWGIIFLIPLIIGFVYFFLLPFIYTIIYSFSYVESGRKFQFIGLDNYIFAFKVATAKNSNYQIVEFSRWLTEGIISIVADIPIILIFSMIMAVVLNSKFKGRALARAIFFIPVIFNSQAIDAAVNAYSTLANTMQGATKDLFAQMFDFKAFLIAAKIPKVLVDFLGKASNRIYDIIAYSGIQILIFLAAIQSVPKSLYEAAKIEGATQYEMFWKITFPMVSPMLLAAAIYTVVDAFLRSPVLTILKRYSGAGSAAEKGSTLTDIGIGFEVDGVIQLSNYGINAAMAIIFTAVIGLIIAVILGILSKVVFYYDK